MWRATTACPAFVSARATASPLASVAAVRVSLIVMIAHGTLPGASLRCCSTDTDLDYRKCRFPDAIIAVCAPIAQLDRASGYEPGGRKFESCWAHHTLLGDFVPKPPYSLSRALFRHARSGREAHFAALVRVGLRSVREPS